MEKFKIDAWLVAWFEAHGGTGAARQIYAEAREAGWPQATLRRSWARLRAGGAGTTTLTGFGADKRSVWTYTGERQS